MATNDPLQGVLGLPFAEQIEYFIGKLNLPTQKWDDLLQSAHDLAFVVAGAMKADLLADLHASLLKHMHGGGGLDGYRKDFLDIIEKYGWAGFTGDDRTADNPRGGAGMAWRPMVTYMTNMRTSHAAGRYKQLTDSPALQYWMWKHSPLVKEPRAQHLAWDGLVLPANHPFWKQHYPPQIPPHWGCSCRVVGLERPDDALALGGDPHKALPDDWETIDAEHKDPALLASGHNFAPGANRNASLREMIEKKLLTYPPAIGLALKREMG